MESPVSRRGVLAAGAASLAGSWQTAQAQSPGVAASTLSPAKGFRYCLNTSTIRGQKLDLVTEVQIAAQAGYDGVEPWVREIQAYVNNGGQLKDLKRRISDLGLTVESAIGFANWIVDDEAKRAAGLEQAKRDMDLVQQIGGRRIAAPPAGATRKTDLDLFQAALRYRALLDVGQKIGVVPQAEVWGFSSSLSRLGETLFVAVESGHENACVLPDVYHIFRGGSDFAGLKLLSDDAIHVFHVNDYPAQPERTQMKDADRVYPGDGVAPLNSILKTLHDNGVHCALSLELFNPGYWKQDALEVARTGLSKTRGAVNRALDASRKS